MKLKPRTWTVAAVCFGVLLYLGFWVSAARSDGYAFLGSAIRHAREVQSRLGQVQTINLSFLGTLNESFVGSDRWVTMTFNVTGERGKAVVKASAQRTNGVWTVTRSSIDGDPINLNQ